VTAPSAYLALLGLSAGICLGVAWLAWRNRETPGATWLAFSLLAAGFWLVTTFLSWTAPDLATAMFWRRLTYLGITVDVAAVFVFALAFAGYDRLVRPGVLAGLAVEPVLVNALVWTNDVHGLVWAPATTPGTPATFQYGPVFWANVAYAYLLIAGVAYLLLRVARQSGGFYRGQLVPIVVGIVAPAASNAVFIVTGSPYDLAPIAFAVTGVAFSWAVFHRQFLDLVPVARDRLIEEMEDLVLVVDREGRVIDANPAADTAFDGPLIGEPVSRVTAGQVTVESGRLAGLPEEVTVSVEGRNRRFHPRSSTLAAGASDRAGALLVLRDVTALKAREAELDQMQEVMQRFLRHNLRNEVNVIMAQATELAESVPAARDTARDISGTARTIAEQGEKARIAEQIISTTDRVETDAGEVARSAVEEVRESNAEVVFETDLEAPCRVRASPYLDVAVSNLLENAVEHNDADRPAIDVTLRRREESARLAVSDNGGGVPAGEREAVVSPSESALEHGSGLGLYLVKWVARKSQGELDFGPEGGVALELPLAGD